MNLWLWPIIVTWTLKFQIFGNSLARTWYFYLFSFNKSPVSKDWKINDFASVILLINRNLMFYCKSYRFLLHGQFKYWNPIRPTHVQYLKHILVHAHVTYLSLLKYISWLASNEHSHLCCHAFFFIYNDDIQNIDN